MIFKEFRWWPGTESVLPWVLKTRKLLNLHSANDRVSQCQGNQADKNRDLECLSGQNQL